MTEVVTAPIFEGFVEPEQNWSKLPHQLISALPLFGTKAELAVVLYILRHTWGYHELEKKITLDEFEFGRWERDRDTGEYTRMDKGVGMSRPSIIRGLKDAAAHGFIEVVVDTSDKARVKKLYSLKNEGLRNFTPEVKKLYPRGKETLYRSEKETIERNLEKETKDSVIPENPQPAPEQPVVSSPVGEGAVPDTPVIPDVLTQADAIVAQVEEQNPLPLKPETSMTPDEVSKPKEKIPRKRKGAAPALEPPDMPVYQRFFNGVALVCFGIDVGKLNDKTRASFEKSTGRIGMISAWLYREGDTTPERLWEFAKAYKQKYKKASLPRVLDTFILHWTEWEQTAQPVIPGAPQPFDNRRMPTDADYALSPEMAAFAETLLNAEGSDVRD